MKNAVQATKKEWTCMRRWLSLENQQVLAIYYKNENGSGL